jgi:hypothetical protein
LYRYHRWTYLLKKKKKTQLKIMFFLEFFLKGQLVFYHGEKKKIDNYIIIFVKQPRKTNKNKLS